MAAGISKASRPKRNDGGLAEEPVHIPERARRLAAVEAFAEEPVAAAVRHPPRGNSRACSRPRSSARHHSGAMRSGPSARATSCTTRRQRKRSGGPSGTSASTSTGSGPREEAERPVGRRSRAALRRQRPGRRRLPGGRSKRPSGRARGRRARGYACRRGSKRVMRPARAARRAGRRGARGRRSPPPRRQGRSAPRQAARRGARQGAPCRSRSRRPSRSRAPQSRSAKSAATSAAARSGAAVPTCGADDRAVGAEEGRLEQARAEPVPLKRRRQRPRQRGHRLEQRGSVDDRLGETPLGGKPRRRPARRQHLVEPAERLVEAGDEADAEAGGKRRARLADQAARSASARGGRAAPPASASIRSAATGSSASASASPPGGTQPPAP